MLTPDQEAKLKKALFANSSAKNEYIQIKLDECIQCGVCVATCPTEALTIVDNGIAVSSECVGCLACVGECPIGAIKEV